VTLDHLLQLADSKEKTEWINAYVKVDVARMDYAQDKQFAIDAYNSGQFDELKKLSPQQAVSLTMMKLQIGREMGFSRADSVRYVVFINGRPTLENELVAARLQASGYFLDPQFFYEEVPYKGTTWQRCIGCRVWLSKWNPGEKRYVPVTDRDGEQVSVSFTEADAAHAKIWENGKEKALSEKFNYQSWAKDMFWWKCVARVKKYYAPNVLRGITMQDEALDMMPVEQMPPELLPPDLQQPQESSDLAASPEAEKPARATLRDVLKQDSFLDEPAREPGEGE
jgi:hypothetical protein